MTKITRIGVVGCKGRMGRRIIECAADDPRLEVVATADADGVTGDFSICHSVIDFSLPSATERVVELTRTGDAGLVSGVTGRTEQQEALIRAESKHRPLFIAANFSVGIAVLGQLVQQATEKLGVDFDIEISETHHRHKVDAPSGTALYLAKTAADARAMPWPDALTQHMDNTERRSADSIGIASLRGGSVIGEHTAHFFGQSERIELVHRAENRDVFARGALRAAIWLMGKNPGHYGMPDLVA